MLACVRPSPFGFVCVFRVEVIVAPSPKTARRARVLSASSAARDASASVFSSPLRFLETEPRRSHAATSPPWGQKSSSTASRSDSRLGRHAGEAPVECLSTPFANANARHRASHRRGSARKRAPLAFCSASFPSPPPPPSTSMSTASGSSGCRRAAHAARWISASSRLELLAAAASSREDTHAAHASAEAKWTGHRAGDDSGPRDADGPVEGSDAAVDRAVGPSSLVISRWRASAFDADAVPCTGTARPPPPPPPPPPAPAAVSPGASAPGPPGSSTSISMTRGSTTLPPGSCSFAGGFRTRNDQVSRSTIETLALGFKLPCAQVMEEVGPSLVNAGGGGPRRHARHFLSHAADTIAAPAFEGPDGAFVCSSMAVTKELSFVSALTRFSQASSLSRASARAVTSASSPATSAADARRHRRQTPGAAAPPPAAPAASTRSSKASLEMRTVASALLGSTSPCAQRMGRRSIGPGSCVSSQNRASHERGANRYESRPNASAADPAAGSPSGAAASSSSGGCSSSSQHARGGAAISATRLARALRVSMRSRASSTRDANVATIAAKESFSTDTAAARSVGSAPRAAPAAPPPSPPISSRGVPSSSTLS